MFIIIKRESYMSRIRNVINCTELVKILVGIRRCGKSVMLELIKEELMEQGVNPNQFISLNFEVLKNTHLSDYIKLYESLSKKIENMEGRSYLFLDEIQEVSGWERCVNSFRVEYDVDIYVTGSNSHLLNSEYATYLAGRYILFEIHPFSFAEFTAADTSLTSREMFERYLKLGGMPFLVVSNHDDNTNREYLMDLYNSVILKDVIAKNNIRDVDLLERLITYIMANIGRTFSATSISKYFKSENRNVSPETILNYIKACESAYLIYRAKRQDLVGKKILTVNEKYYISDHGLREAVYGENISDIEIVLENIVYMELRRRGYKVFVGKAQDKEVDFVAQNRQSFLYVQVSYLLATEDTRQREFGAFRSIRDNFPKYVLSMDEFNMSRNGYKHMNIRDFLLEDSWD